MLTFDSCVREAFAVHAAYNLLDSLSPAGRADHVMSRLSQGETSKASGDCDAQMWSSSMCAHTPMIITLSIYVMDLIFLELRSKLQRRLHRCVSICTGETTGRSSTKNYRTRSAGSNSPHGGVVVVGGGSRTCFSIAGGFGT